MGNIVSVSSSPFVSMVVPEACLTIRKSYWDENVAFFKKSYPFEQFEAIYDANIVNPVIKESIERNCERLQQVFGSQTVPGGFVHGFILSAWNDVNELTVRLYSSMALSWIDNQLAYNYLMECRIFAAYIVNWQDTDSTIGRWKN